jgi:microcystin-dependent protein
MSKISLSGNPSGTGTFTIASPNSNTNRTLNLPDTSGTVVVSGSSELTPAGTVITVAMNTAPTGYLKANGAVVSRSTYAALFAAIGTTFGAGNGSTTFALPDLRGEFIRGWDDGRGVDSGRVFGSAQSQEIQSHSHAWNGYGGSGSVRPNLSMSGSFVSNTAPEGTAVANHGGAETRPRNVALLACIKF